MQSKLKTESNMIEAVLENFKYLCLKNRSLIQMSNYRKQKTFPKDLFQYLY